MKIVQNTWVGMLVCCMAVHTLLAQGQYASQTYTNVFEEVGLTSGQTEAKAMVKAAYDAQLDGINEFSVDKPPESKYFDFESDMGGIHAWNGNVKSEGQSHAMMLAVQMDDQEKFNKLWKFARTKCYNTSGTWKGFFAEQTTADGQIVDNKKKAWISAEQNITVALYMAHYRWGSTSGIFDYQTEAENLATHLYENRGTASDNGGVGFSSENNLPLLCDGSCGEVSTSHLCPALCDYIANVHSDSDVKSFFADAATASRARLKKAISYSPVYLPPIMTEYDGSKVTGAHGKFHPWSHITVFNIALDYMWWQADSWQKEFATELQNFFFSEGIDGYGYQYEISGSEISSNNDGQGGPTLRAGMGALSLFSTSNGKEEFAADIWKDSIGVIASQGRGVSYILGLMLMAGEFKIYGPTTTAISPRNAVSSHALLQRDIQAGRSAFDCSGRRMHTVTQVQHTPGVVLVKTRSGLVRRVALPRK